MEKLIFRLSLATLLLVPTFLYGYLVGKRHFPPYKLLDSAEQAVVSLKNFGEIVPPNRLRVPPEGASREAFKVHRPADVLPGHYVMMGWNHYQKNYALWLYDQAGELQHLWELDYEKYDADGPLNGTDSPHGMDVLQDGSVLINFDRGDVLARVDACGDPVWTKPGVFHHSIERAEDGSYWTWHSNESAYSPYQYLLNFDADDGSTLNQIGLVEDVIAGLEANNAEFLLRTDTEFQKSKVAAGSKRDVFHPNDIEPLWSKDAAAFPDFAVGDLMISLRNLSMVAVIDPVSHELKWSAHGPWRYQHDPDFRADGMISVYNNNSDLRRSEIVLIDPRTEKGEIALNEGNARFYSNAMGKHQNLPNGGTLVVVPGEGRIMVTDARGDVALEINNLAADDSKFNGHVGNGLWLPQGYFDSLPSCDQRQESGS